MFFVIYKAVQNMGICIHSHGRVKISDVFIGVLRESVGVTPTIKLRISLGKVNIYCCLKSYPRNYSILH
jgi:hypothetical protein